MKKVMIAMFMSMGVVSSWAALPINTSFSSTDSPSYSDGDLASQNDWAQIGSYSNAFDVSAAGSGFISTITNGYTGGELPVSMQVDSPNATDTEWDGSIDFQISRTTNAWDGGAVVEFGLSVANNFLNPGNESAGDEWDIRIATENAGGEDRLDISIQKSPGWATPVRLTPAQAGWDGAGGSDLTTDNLRAVFNVRKTRVDKTYAISVDVINLDTSTTNFGSVAILQTVSNAYNAATLPYFVIQHDGGADIGTPSERFDATIDALSIDVTENVAPLLDAPVLIATGLDGAVSLSWNTVFEAGSYDLTWSSTSNGTYAAVSGGSGLTTNAFTDTGLPNGIERWYKVAAKATGATDAVSDPVPATPVSIAVNASVLNTTFTNLALYSNGDLAGQDLWQAISASNPKAFEVDVSGDGFADSEPFAAFATNGGNHVVYNRLIANGVGHEWSGTVSFNINAIADGDIVTNIVGTTTNIGTIANLSGAEEFFRFGLSSDTDNTDIDPQANDDIVWVVRNDASDKLGIGLNMRGYDINTSLRLEPGQIGWDPLWSSTNAAPDLETDLITLDWNIRNSTVSDLFNGQVIATVGGNSYTGLIVYTEDTLSQSPDVYAAETVKFAMGHRIPDGQALYVAVDSVSVAHTNASAIPYAAPILSAASGVASLTIDLNWSNASEADSFKIYRSEVYGSEGSLIDTVTGTSYTDADPTLQDVRSYMYTVKAVYDGGSAVVASSQVAVWALAQKADLWFPGGDSVRNWCTGNEIYGGDTWTAVAGNGFTHFVEGTGIDGSLLIAGDIGNHNTNLCPLVYGLGQGDIDANALRANSGSDTVRYRMDNASFLFWVQGPAGPVNASVENPEIEYEVGSMTLVKLGTSDPGYVHIAIRNSGQWYVTENTYTKNQDGIINVLNEKWIPLTLATVTDTDRMTVIGAGAGTLGSSLSLTSVDAVGWFIDSMDSPGTTYSYLNLLKMTYGSSPSTYQNWAAGFGVYNDAGAFTNDYDSDGISNGEEWGLNGNPNNSDSRGALDRYSSIDETGTNFLYVYPRLQSADRPVYTIVDDGDLVYAPDFTNVTAHTVLGFGGPWINGSGGENNDLESVTNSIPITENVRFYKLEITEP
ncbi:hypothetical protein P4B35_08490 [Pontiellaceae bacterium B12227]|nr:hypothetical protein [Pontiellaceae bacterium B12227]